MLMLIPFKIDSIEQQYPFVNWGLVAITTAVSLFVMFGDVSEETVANLILVDWHFAGLFGHLVIHADLFHLVGNMIFLWVFGNAICANINQILYLFLYLFLGLSAAAAHLVLDGDPAIGASGAINGVIGLAFAIYPRDDVDTFWLFLIRGGVFSVPVWVLVLTWLAFDLFGVATQGASVAYWAHLGGLASGVLIGLALLALGWVQLTIYDKQTLLEFFKGEKPDGPMS